MDRYPDDLWALIRELTARVTALEAQLQTRPAMTQATQGWRLANMSPPSVGANECHIGCQGGDFFVATSDGVRGLPSQAEAVGAPNITITNAPATYSATHSQLLATACDALITAQADLISSLQSADLMGF